MTSEQQTNSTAQLFQEEPAQSPAGNDDSVTETESGSGSAENETSTESESRQEISLDGAAVVIDAETTAGELREAEVVSDQQVFTYRSPDGIEALADDDVVAEHVEEGGQIHTQPLADTEVFGTS
ncbi:hypothetical protein [Natronoglomus mannanivorans]|uniref:Uncharacterized protein n=1 Tax=Natronoglomus mannanivorans TaxID=2979990 RepID=A0AAP2Z587_9EURY|nr:hypothetical protein [Halobacteria archaeon AArc-xg1-1]